MTKVKKQAGRNIQTGVNRTKLAEGVQAYFGVAMTGEVRGNRFILVAESVAALGVLYKAMAGVELDPHLTYPVGVTDADKLRTAQWPPPCSPTT